MKRTVSGIILSLSIAGALLPCAAQDGFQGLMSDLEILEKRMQAPGDPAAPMVQRLTNLEQRVFGAPRSGSLVERVQSLKSAANELPPPQQQNLTPGYPVQSNSANYYPSQPGPVQRQPAPSFHNAAGPNINSGAGWAPGNQPNNLNGTKPAPQNPNSSISGTGWVPTANPTTAPAISSGAPPQFWRPNPGQPPVQNSAPPSPSSMASPAIPQSSTQPIPYNKMVSTPLPVQGIAIVRKNFAPDALPLLNAFPPNLVRMEPDNTGLIASPDYYHEVNKASKGKAIRFKAMPIPVYIQPYPDKAFVNCVVRAFESWETRTDGAIKFSQIDNPNEARIQVVWKHLGGNKDNQGCLLGAHTILKYTNHGSGNLSLIGVGAIPVPIYIPRLGPKYTVPPQVMEVNLDLIMTKDPASKYPCLQNIVTHELGHALGLLGHSPNVADIMYPVTDEHSRLSQRDINTVIKLYNQKCDIPL